MLADCNSSKDGPLMPLRTRSQVGTVKGRGRFSLLDPFKKQTTRLFLPTDCPDIGE